MKRTLLAMLLAALVPAVVFAHDDDDDDDEHEGRGARATPTSPQYTAECGSCHLAYPPRFLPARSWKALLGNLGDHFGQNAEVDPATAKQLEAWLVANAGRDVPGPTPLRITELRWWVKEHDELAPSVFQRKAITSPANCAACHPGANQGAFGEHQVKIPRDAAPAR